MNLRNFLFLVFLFFIISCNESGSTSVAPENELQEKTGEQEQKSVISDTISVKRPVKNKVISSPLAVEGEARGYWFFEATATVEITDEANNLLGRGYIKAEGEWMTEDFVSFSGTIDFDPSGAENGLVVFHRANASGLPEHDRSIRIPVKFQQ